MSDSVMPRAGLCAGAGAARPPPPPPSTCTPLYPPPPPPPSGEVVREEAVEKELLGDKASNPSGAESQASFCDTARPPPPPLAHPPPPPLPQISANAPAPASRVSEPSGSVTAEVGKQEAETDKNKVGETSPAKDRGTSDNEREMGCGSSTTAGAPAFPVWRMFLPALFFYPIWLSLMSAQDLWVTAYSDGWPMAITMVFGSLIAGSTPLGGGVLAFPVSVLVLKLSPKEGRALGCMIQSVGMTSASYLLLSCKRHLLHAELITYSLLAGTWGIAIGFWLQIPALMINVVFTTVVISFAIVYAYLVEYVLPQAERLAGSSSEAGATPTQTTTPHHVIIVRRVLLIIVLVFGGILTSQVGSGSDTASFIFTVLIWNAVSPAHDHIDIQVATASSVIIMATHSIETAILILISGGSTPKVYNCLLCATPVVVLGAPLGALLLRPSMVKVLQIVFYLLAIIQFVCFAALVLKTDLDAWQGPIVGITLSLGGVIAHFYREKLPIKDKPNHNSNFVRLHELEEGTTRTTNTPKSNWQEVYNHEYKAPYWWNQKTGETTWMKPAALM
jgi:uncharacterized membrane protein YfcA